MYLKNTKRELKSASEADKIDRIIQKYVNVENLYIRNDQVNERVQFLEHPDTDKLILNFTFELVEKKIKIFTSISERYVEFELDVIKEAGQEYPPNSYLVQMTNSSLALAKREFPRINFTEHKPEVINIAVMKVKETQAAFLKSLSVKMIIDQFVEKLSEYDQKKVYYSSDDTIPPEVQVVIKTGQTLLIPNLDAPSDYIKDFGEKGTALKNEIDTKINNLKTNNKSLLVKPVHYYPLIGKGFNAAYMHLSTREREIGEADLTSTDDFMEDLSEKIRNGNCIDSKSKGNVLDVSEGGVKIQLFDENLVKKLVSQDVLTFEMEFIEDNPLKVSGRIVYIYKDKDNSYHIGIDFEGSHFGRRLKKVINNHVKKFNQRFK